MPAPHKLSSSICERLVHRPRLRQERFPPLPILVIGRSLWRPAIASLSPRAYSHYVRHHNYDDRGVRRWARHASFANRRQLLAKPRRPSCRLGESESDSGSVPDRESGDRWWSHLRAAGPERIGHAQRRNRCKQRGLPVVHGFPPNLPPGVTGSLPGSQTAVFPVTLMTSANTPPGQYFITLIDELVGMRNQALPRRIAAREARTIAVSKRVETIDDLTSMRNPATSRRIATRDVGTDAVFRPDAMIADLGRTQGRTTTGQTAKRQVNAVPVIEPDDTILLVVFGPSATPSPSPSPISTPTPSSCQPGGGTTNIAGAPAQPQPLAEACSPPPPPYPSIQARIYKAAENFFGQETCGLHGAPPRDQCMAAVNQVLLNAGLQPLGPGANGSNYVPTAILNGLKSGRLIAIAQKDAGPGDLVVRHSPGDTYTSVSGNEHIGVCETKECTQDISNSSSAHTGDPTCPTGVFRWRSPSTMDNYDGSPYLHGYSDFYRVVR